MGEAILPSTLTVNRDAIGNSDRTVAQERGASTSSAAAATGIVLIRRERKNCIEGEDTDER